MKGLRDCYPEREAGRILDVPHCLSVPARSTRRLISFLGRAT